MKTEKLDIEGLVLITPKRHGDARGWFCESWSRESYKKNGIDADFIQDNMSLSVPRHTVRGLHFQIAPFAQAKLVSVPQGRILDVAVDIRPGSATYGRHVAIELSAENGQQLYIPAGFAHGFCTLAENTLVSYKINAPYAPAHERGILWHDPDLKISWPVSPKSAIVSEKDCQYPQFKDFKNA